MLCTSLPRYPRFHYDSTKLPISTNALLLRFQYVLGVLTTLPLRSWRLDCVTTTLLLRSWRLSYVHGDLQHASWRFTARTCQPGYKYVTCLALSSLLNVKLSNPHQRKCHLEREEKQTLLVLPPSLRQLNRSKSLLQKMLRVRSNGIYPSPTRS